MANTAKNEWARIYAERVLLIVDQVCKHFGIEGRRGQLSTRVTERPEFNARCGMDRDGRTFIEVNLGVAFICEDSFMRLLSHQNIWPDVGDRLLEHDGTLVHDFYVRADDLFTHGALTETYSRPVPGCPVRSLYAGRLNSLAWDFTVLHELGHALHGHLAFGNAGASHVFEELPSMAEVLKDPLTRQALESDADTFAVAILLKRTDAPHERLNRPNDPALRRLGMAIDVLRAVYTSFHLFCAGLKDLEVHQLDRTHPPPRVRQMLVVSALLNFLDVTEKSPEMAAKLVAEMQRMEEHYVHLTGRTVFKNGIEGRLRDRHALKVMERWREVYEEVAKNSWIPIPKPVDDSIPAAAPIEGSP